MELKKKKKRKKYRILCNNVRKQVSLILEVSITSLLEMYSKLFKKWEEEEKPIVLCLLEVCLKPPIAAPHHQRQEQSPVF